MIINTHSPEWPHVNYECPNLYDKLAHVDRWFSNFNKTSPTILRIHVTSPILEEHISAITLTQQRKQWLIAESDIYRPIYIYFFYNKT